MRIRCRTVMAKNVTSVHVSDLYGKTGQPLEYLGCAGATIVTTGVLFRYKLRDFFICTINAQFDKKRIPLFLELTAIRIYFYGNLFVVCHN